MTRKKVRLARPAPRRNVPTALGDPGGSKAGIQFYDPETGVPSDICGWGWAALASDKGIAAAAAEPLPGRDGETEARHCAHQMQADTADREWVRNVAEGSARLAIDSYRTYLQRAREPREATSRSDQMAPRTVLALADSERWGRLAAWSNRVHVLLSGEQGGVN